VIDGGGRVETCKVRRILGKTRSSGKYDSQ
jgi:hypothetical protein